MKMKELDQGGDIPATSSISKCRGSEFWSKDSELQEKG